MTLLIMVIVSGIIFTIFALSSEYLATTHQEKQIKDCVTLVSKKISLMTAYRSEHSQLLMTLRFPPLVDKVIFGCNSIEQLNTSNISYYSRNYVTVQLTNGKQTVISSPVAFSDKQGKPLVFHKGTYQVLFSLKKRDGEVIAVGSIM